VAWTFEFVLARLPIGRAPKVRAARVDHKNAVGRAIDPDAVFLLELGIDSESELGRITNLENCVGFEKSAGKKESEESQKPGGKECRYAYPNQATTAAVNISIRRAGIR
jgi:hypothetical protein